MPGLVESISTINQAVRTMLVLGLLGVVCAASWYGYTLVNSREREAKEMAVALDRAESELQRVALDLADRNRQVQSLQETVTQQLAQIEHLDTAMRLLKVDHRVARLWVRDQRELDGQLVSYIEFQELDDEGQRVGAAREFSVPGDVIYVDSWIVKFDDEYVEQARIHRSTSLVLFRRVFGESQSPNEAFALDEVGARPQIFSQGGQPSELERQIWDDFWSVANDRARQEELGIRAAHGEAPSIKVEKGKSYRITIRASGGLSVRPEETAPSAGREKSAAG